MLEEYDKNRRSPSALKGSVGDVGSVENRRSPSMLSGSVLLANVNAKNSRAVHPPVPKQNKSHLRGSDDRERVEWISHDRRNRNKRISGHF